MAQIEQSIDRYLAAMDTADRTQSEGAEARTTRLRDKSTVWRPAIRPPWRVPPSSHIVLPWPFIGQSKI